MIEVIPVNAGKIERDLAMYGEKAVKVYAEAVRVGGQKFRDHTKKMRPVSSRTTGWSTKGMPTDTGNLRKSIRAKRISRLAAGVGIGAAAQKYGWRVHEGAVRGGKARPFFEWSAEMGGQREVDRVFEHYSKQLFT